MNVLRRTAVVAGFGAAVASAVPAHAATLEGSYTATVTSSTNYRGAQTTTWVLTPCGSDCVRVSAQNSELHGQDGNWAGTFELHDQTGEVVVCTRTITPSLVANDMCPQPAGVMVSYQLTKS
jgi:hypothetical protein